MLQIELQDISRFTPGYPYHNSIDTYFQQLTTTDITSFGLTVEVVGSINAHKKYAMELDVDLHKRLIELIKFVIDYDKVGKPIVKIFEESKIKERIIRAQINENTKTHLDTLNTLKYILQELDSLNKNIAEVDQLISFVQTKIPTSEKTTVASYIEEANNFLETYNTYTSKFDLESSHYLNALDEISTSIATKTYEIGKYAGYDIILRDLYIDWEKRDREYYSVLIEYFKSEFENAWPYGVSLMFGEHQEVLESINSVMQDITNKLQDILSRKVYLEIENTLQKYVIEIADSDPLIAISGFNYLFSRKKSSLISSTITENIRIYDDKLKVFRSLLPEKIEKGAAAFKESVLEKIAYISTNIKSGLDQQHISRCELKISEYQDFYDRFVEISSRKNYWVALAEKNIRNTIIVDLKKHSETADIIGYQPDIDLEEITELKRKLQFYRNEKETYKRKMTELLPVRINLEEIDAGCNSIGGKLNVELAQITKIKNNSVAAYLEFFKPRLKFYTQSTNFEINNAELVSVINGNLFYELHQRYDTFTSYIDESNWFDLRDRNILNNLYREILDHLKNTTLKQWNTEFLHEITDAWKCSVLNEYLNNIIKNLFGKIQHFLLKNLWNPEFTDIVAEESAVIKEKFIMLVNVAANIGGKISVMYDLYDYDKHITFDLTTEDTNNVISTFNTMLDAIVAYSHDKNIEFKIVSGYVVKKLKIEDVWLDMGRNYDKL